jgi:hypothetical protein
LASFKQKMIDAMVSSSDGVAVAASAGKFETAARKLDGTCRETGLQVLWLNQA